MLLARRWPGPLSPGELHQGGNIVVWDRDILAALGRAGVPGRDIELAQLLRLPQLPRKRMLPPPAAYQQYVHKISDSRFQI
jgi:hypothetical protein